MPLMIKGLIGFGLYKRGILKMVTKIAYVYKQNGNKLSVTYKKFNGFDDYNFSLNQDSSVTLAYDVTVEEGTLLLEIRENLVWSQEVTTSQHGTVDFIANRQLHSLRLEGKHTKGGCEIEFTTSAAR